LNVPEIRRFGINEMLTTPRNGISKRKVIFLETVNFSSGKILIKKRKTMGIQAALTYRILAKIGERSVPTALLNKNIDNPQNVAVIEKRKNFLFESSFFVK